MTLWAGVPRNLPLALPVLVDHRIPAGPPGRVVDALDWSSLELTFHDHGLGTSAYPPILRLTGLAYCEVTQGLSFRRIRLCCRQDLGFFWIPRLEGSNPCCALSLVLRAQQGPPRMDRPGRVAGYRRGTMGWTVGALDGAKVHADDTKHQAMSCDRITAIIPPSKTALKRILTAYGATNDLVPADSTVAGVAAAKRKIPSPPLNRRTGAHPWHRSRFADGGAPNTREPTSITQPKRCRCQ